MSRSLLILLAFAAGAMLALANPEPDIPVHCAVAKDGSITMRAEVDPRCFTEDPMGERYLMKVDLSALSPEVLDGLKAKVAEALPRWLEVIADPVMELKPAWKLAFTGQQQAVLVKADDPVVIAATWTFTPPAGLKAIKLRALDAGRYAVVLTFEQEGAKPRTATLFPGETSQAMPVRK